MKYDGFVLVPPRAETAIPSAFLARYEAKGWVAQAKKNGTNSMIFVPPGRDDIFAKTRHQTDHKAWRFSPGSLKFFQGLPGSGWWVINAELMHSKVHGIRDTHYVHDVLVADNEWLLGEKFEKRQKLLQSIVTARSETLTHYVVDDHTWLARNHYAGFRAIYDSFTKPEDEGLVLKNPKAVLADKHWLVKCRRVNKNFSF